MKKIFLPLLTLLFATSIVGCTKKFEEYNKDLGGVTRDDLASLPTGGPEIKLMINWLIPNQENGYQMTFDMLGPYSGFAAAPSFVSDFSAYSPRLNWNDYPMEDTFSKHLYPYYRPLVVAAEEKKDAPYLALGNILRDAITHSISDIYGPVPYSKNTGISLSVPYDTQAELYKNLLSDLKAASEVLAGPAGANSQYAEYDNVYKGDLRAWATYARSLMLRMAIRISGVAPDMAKEYGEWAIANGVITTNAENAVIATTDNPLFKTNGWNDSRVGADIVEYMLAFGDPRTDAFFTKVRSGKPFGLRSPSASIKGDAAVISKYSSPNIKADSPIYVLTAAEVSFLKAEAKLLGWNVGAETAEQLYQQGIKLSCEQWGVEVGDYLASSKTRGGFTDEVLPATSLPDFSSAISANWADAKGDKEKQKARIITQKWIAMYPYNVVEAWSEWRRTGYPNLMPAVVNSSAGDVQDIKQVDGRDTGGMQRLMFVSSEKSQNKEAIEAAIRDLGGKDSYGTPLWWAKRK